MVRVRFAPSPTGYLHVGGARTALYNWLFARNKGGKFLLRIEDTDVQRSSPEMVDYIFESLSWLGLNWDEEPIFQSKRLPIYERIAEELVKKGHAYYCVNEEVNGQVFCREVEKRVEGAAIKFRVPEEGETSFRDIIRGDITFKNRDIEDFVILKSDGFPTYQLACVVDDHEMGITHVIRGEDHIPNTPKQILIYRALSYEPPHFAHLPMILGPDKKKLSKRHGATAVLEYRDAGFLPEALFNFLALLGWSPGGDREIVSKDEMIELFNLERVGKRAAIFDYNKLLWMNGEYIRMKSNDELVKLVTPYFEREGFLRTSGDRETLNRVVPLLKERVRVLKDFVTMGIYFFVEDYPMDEDLLKQYLDPETTSMLRELMLRYEEIGAVEFSKEKVEEILRAYAAEKNVKAAKLIHPLRVILTGKKVGPGLFELMEVLGKERVVKRMKKYLEDTHG